MAYPYPELNPLLQIKCSPAEYQRVLARFTREDGWLKDELLADPEYQSLLPSFTYARCPICGHTLQCRVDIYSPAKWEIGPQLDQTLYPFGYSVMSVRDNIYYTVPADYLPRINESDVSRGTQKFAHCKHFSGVHKFFTLHGEAPPALYWTNYGEVPYINRWMLNSNTPGYVVIFAVPICKVENDAFIPSYTIFSLTYFSSNRDELLRNWHKENLQIMEADHEYYPALVSPEYFTTRRGPMHDLVGHAKEGKLGYIDISRADFPLQIGLNTILPKMYWHIEGRSYFEWEKGKYRKNFEGRPLR